MTPRVSTPDPVGETLDTITALKERAEPDDPHHRWIETFIAHVGRPAAVYVIVAVVASWVLYNTLGFRWLGVQRLDEPPFFFLQGAVALYAALIATCVLVKQNRMARHEERRDHLELQVNLLAEQKATKIIALLEELRHDLPNVQNREDREAEAMKKAIDPHQVLGALEDAESEERFHRRRPT